MFENLSERLERSFKILKGEGKITEINVAETVKDIRKALLDAERAKDKTMSDSVYNARLEKIKKGELETGKVPPLTIIIKALDTANYKNLVDALDEMQICAIGKYVIDQVNDDDLKLLNAAGVK